MSPRTRPAKGFATRERHRVALTAHAFLMIAVLLACALANRMLTPDRFWVQWVALAWAVGFGVHVWIFSRGTMATMGRRRAPGRPPD
ncbi:MAG: 2TM domain-containing protein [Myxococcales bacterium]